MDQSRQGPNDFPTTSYRGTAFDFNNEGTVPSPPPATTSFNYVPGKNNNNNNNTVNMMDSNEKKMNMQSVDNNGIYNKYFKFDEDFDS